MDDDVADGWSILMPVYAFACGSCPRRDDLLLPLGRTGPRVCPDCGAEMTYRFGRVGVRYGAWGFTGTDSLVADSRGKDFRALRERAERIIDG